MEGKLDFGMVGIGVMGSNLLLNLADHGYAVIGFDLKQERADQLEAAASEDTLVKGTTKVEEMVAALKKPRKIMMLVPAGQAVDSVINNLLPHLEQDDILIDGGNSHFSDTNRRIVELQDKGIHFFGMGVSGGEMGARTGPSMMPGGDKNAWQYLKPLLEAIAARSGDVPCVAYMGNGAAGHYVKMVHNGIEYAMMQMISEVYDLMHRGGEFTNEKLHDVFNKWNEGSLQSFLIEVTADIFNTLDDETESPHDFLVDKILDQAGSKGTGKWTSQEAMNLPVPVPSIDMAVAMRDLSVYKPLRTQAAQLYKPEIQKLDLNQQELEQIENGLLFCFAIAYAQGLSMLHKASEVHQMNIPLKDVIRVWKAGCIIRSALLGNFEQAFTKAPSLPNILLDAEITSLMQSLEKDARALVILGVQSKIPLACITSALSYYDALLSEKMPINLVQAQRDYFGAHTYKRIDREGVFHTEWNVDTKK
ncbi:MAG: NADP-dependent phosphogluconate dehydrogenase [Flavisolibacter sp.]